MLSVNTQPESFHQYGSSRTTMITAPGVLMAALLVCKWLLLLALQVTIAPTMTPPTSLLYVAATLVSITFAINLFRTYKKQHFRD